MAPALHVAAAARKRTRRLRCAAGVALACVICAGHEATAAEAGPEAPLDVPIERTRLGNGLRVVLSQDLALPTVALCLAYAVGARHESEERHGFASWVAQVMSQGTGPLPAGTHEARILAYGGRATRAAESDHSWFCELMPKNALELGLWLESERMLHLRITGDRVAAARGSLAEERHATRDPLAPARARLLELVFEDAPAYAGALAGDVGGDGPPHVSAPDLQAFFEAHYAPSNAVLCVAGDFEPEAALSLIRRYFDHPRQGQELPSAEPPRAAEQTQARTAAVSAASADVRATLSAWMIPEWAAPDRPALELAAAVLGAGDASRLHQLMVQQEGVARDIRVWTGDAGGPGVLTIDVILADGGQPDLARRLVAGQLNLLARFGPTPAELSRAKSQVRSMLVQRLDANLSRAQLLATYELLHGSADTLTQELGKRLAVSAEDVKRGVARYLAPQRESRVVVEPGPGENDRNIRSDPTLRWSPSLRSSRLETVGSP